MTVRAMTQMLPDLEQRLRALEEQRIETGLTRVLRMAKMVGFLIGGLAVGTIALVLTAERLAPPANDSTESVAVPMTRRNIVLLLFTFCAPVALGGGLSFASYRKLRGAGSRSAYERRFAEEVAVPLGGRALPDATVEAPAVLPLDRIASSALIPQSIRPEFSRYRLRVAWTNDGVAAEAIACRLIQRYSIRSEQTQRLRVLHDGLLVWYTLPDRWREAFIVADARAYPQVRRLELPIVEVGDERFRRTPPFLDDSSGWAGLLTGPSGWRAMLKDPAQWSGFMVFGRDAEAAVRAATAPVRDAVLQIAERLGVPVMVRFSRDGVVVRIDGAGRFAPSSNDEELMDRLGDETKPGMIADQMARLEADARLLVALPEVGRILARLGG